MKFPELQEYQKNYSINGNVWELKFKNKIKGSLFGECCSEAKSITVALFHPHLRRRMQLVEIYSTFIHELLHAFEFEYGIDLGERRVTELECALMDFFVSNT